MGALGSWSLTAALLFCGAFVIVGDLAFSLHPASRAWRPPPHAERHLAGALRAAACSVLVAVFALCGLAVGAVEVAVPATLEPLGDDGLTGPLLGIWGVGSLLGGIAVARAGAAGDPPRRLAFLLAAWGTRPRGARARHGTSLARRCILLVAGRGDRADDRRTPTRCSTCSPRPAR